MRSIRLHVDRCFIGLIGIFVLSQLCLGLKDTNISKRMLSEKKRILSVIEPKRYLIEKVAFLFASWCPMNSIVIAKGINNIFKELGIDARLLENTIRLCNGSYEFQIYIPRYKKDFLFRYTPLIKNISKLVQNEKFKLEVKLFSSWKPVAIDQLLG